MPRTFTITANMAAAPKGLHAGENVLPFDFNSGATKAGSVSDYIFLGKVPNGALVTGGGIRFGASTAAAAHWALVALATEAGGSFSTLATIRASMTASTAATEFPLITPVKISLSDDRAVQFATLALICTTGASDTVSVSIQGSVKFLADGSTV